jgi:hypothetical protein
MTRIQVTIHPFSRTGMRFEVFGLVRDLDAALSSSKKKKSGGALVHVWSDFPFTEHGKFNR